jgi:5-hydroxyisourate hydrolase
LHRIQSIEQTFAGCLPSGARFFPYLADVMQLMGQLTTHVLDTSAGIPAAAIRIELHALGGEHPRLLCSAVTGANGRCAVPLLAEADFRAGLYTLTFFVADYFRARGVAMSSPPFLDEILVRVGIAEANQHYHVPLLISPWSYSVYRGG